MQFMPTGGIHLGNIADYLAIPNVIACGGSWMVPTHVVTVDLDGDGRDEALFTYGNVLYAIGENDGVGHLAWKATFAPDSWGALLGELSIADVDGTGRPHVLVNTQSGHLYGIG